MNKTIIVLCCIISGHISIYADVYDPYKNIFNHITPYTRWLMYPYEPRSEDIDLSEVTEVRINFQGYGSVVCSKDAQGTDVFEPPKLETEPLTSKDVMPVRSSGNQDVKDESDEQVMNVKQDTHQDAKEKHVNHLRPVRPYQPVRPVRPYHDHIENVPVIETSKSHDKPPAKP